MDENYFKSLNQVDCSAHTEDRCGLTYLSWAWAWAEVKKRFPDATYTIYENSDGWNYFTDGRTCWVKTGVTVNGIEHIEFLPVMDNRNKSIKLSEVTSFDVNKTIQRSITKACARHGLGLYIYAGEDLPEDAPKLTPKEAADTVVSFGKYQGRTLRDIWNTDRPYLSELMQSASTSANIRSAISVMAEAARAGK